MDRLNSHLRKIYDDLESKLGVKPKVLVDFIDFDDCRTDVRVLNMPRPIDCPIEFRVENKDLQEER